MLSQAQLNQPTNQNQVGTNTVLHIGNPITWEVGLGVQGHLQLLSELEATVGYI